MTFAPDGRTLVSGGTDTYTQLWDVTDPRTPAILGSLAGAGNAVNSVAVSADGTLLAIGSADALIQVANVADPRTPLVLDADGRLSTPGTVVLQIALTPDGRGVLSGHSDGTVRLWDLPVHYVGNTRQVQTVQFSPDGHTVAAAGYDGSVRLWPVDRRGSRRRREPIASASSYSVRAGSGAHDPTGVLGEEHRPPPDPRPPRLLGERDPAGVRRGEGQRCVEQRLQPQRPHDRPVGVLGGGGPTRDRGVAAADRRADTMDRCDRRHQACAVVEADRIRRLFDSLVRPGAAS